MDFTNGSFVQPGFDEGPDGGKEVRGVDDEHVAHCLGVVVLANGRGCRNIVLDLVEARDTSIVQVQNSTTSLYKVSNLLGTGRASVPEELFIL